MRTIKTLALLLASAVSTAFVSNVDIRHASVTGAGYVPDGMDRKQYDQLKRKENEKQAKKKFGMGGVKGFESRSLASFQKAMERGEAGHLMPVNPSKVRSGEIPLKDVPYMQRGGAWDNKDLTVKKKGWMNSGFGMKAFNDGKAAKMKSNSLDKAFNNRKPGAGIFGTGGGIPWNGAIDEPSNQDKPAASKKGGFFGR